MTAHETAWAGAVDAALLGTGREAPAPAGDPSPLGRALDALREHGPEARLLSAAALLAGYRRAGVVAPRGATPPPPPAPEDVAGRCSPLAAGVLMQILGGSPPALAAEWLVRASAAGCAPPAELLPALLDFARRHPGVRDTVAETIGARGRWLAARNPEWAFAADVDPHGAWATGDTEMRIRVLRALRRTDPAAALALLRNGWDAEPPRERVAFLAELETGLGMDDEPFLEEVLDDRRKEVRAAAAGLLARIPGSRLVERMTERAAPRLHLERTGGIVRRALGVGATVRVELPDKADAAMKRDGIESKRDWEFGEHAWMLFQLLAAVPPSTWSERWGLDADHCVAAARRSEDARLLVGAWTHAAVRFSDARWVEAILLTAPDAEVVSLPPLAGALPAATIEARILERIAKRGTLDDHRAVRLLDEAAAPWSAALTRTVLQHLAPLTSDDHALRERLRAYALRMDPAAAAAALGEHTGSWVEIVHLRHTLHKAIPA